MDFEPRGRWLSTFLTLDAALAWIERQHLSQWVPEVAKVWDAMMRRNGREGTRAHRLDYYLLVKGSAERPILLIVRRMFEVKTGSVLTGRNPLDRRHK